MIFGIDEAGRGPVIGPMVICCAGIDEKKEDLLRELGVKDSKQLTKSEREIIFKELEKILDYKKVLMIEPREIDNFVKNSSLNELEAYYFSKLINEIEGKIFLDCPDVNVNLFLNRLKKYTSKEVVASHKADEKYLIVSAASIIAKVIRDQEIEKLKEKYNYDFGSGYPSDPKTKEFLKYIKKNKLYIPELRYSWKSIRDFKQQTLF